ncbi:hypothetical protein CEUSTIGMA_g4988.t1 [Chlamydomonas eustigma]|uniref:Uncharacterized protein n=1 Tax=Chlamydomonas eustigma TaxID=1157962 RepID=A0A250X390_9CHLO|nr:hypothetical protein CEUSTIGMA_g4988.t1 [Chlamydomonas eustigma]|eukprot:GAX77544.1 hypothetical protein CEUSTIGMA_g4988.t1 [Chlamydomonas eustigma]
MRNIKTGSWATDSLSSRPWLPSFTSERLNPNPQLPLSYKSLLNISPVPPPLSSSNQLTQQSKWGVLPVHYSPPLTAALQARRSPDQLDTAIGDIPYSPKLDKTPVRHRASSTALSSAAMTSYQAGYIGKDPADNTNSHLSLAFKDHWEQLHLACLSMIGALPFSFSTFQSSGKLMMRALKMSLIAKSEMESSSDLVMEAALIALLKIASWEEGHLISQSCISYKDVLELLMYILNGTNYVCKGEQGVGRHATKIRSDYSQEHVILHCLQLLNICLASPCNPPAQHVHSIATCLSSIITMKQVSQISTSVCMTRSGGRSEKDTTSLPESSDPPLQYVSPSLHVVAAVQCMAALCALHVLHPSMPLSSTAVRSSYATLRREPQIPTPRKKLYPDLLMPHATEQISKRDSLIAPNQLPLAHVLKQLHDIVMDPLEHHYLVSDSVVVSDSMMDMFFAALDALTALSHNIRYTVSPQS